MRELSADIERVLARVEEVEILGERRPRTPRHTLVQRGAGNVFYAFHELDQRRLLTRRTRCETDSAVAHHQRGDAVAERRVELVVPRDLAVVVRVHVDPTGRDDRAVGVDRALAIELAADRSNVPVVDGNISGESFGAGPVDDRSAANYELMCHRSCLPRRRPRG